MSYLLKQLELFTKKAKEQPPEEKLELSVQERAEQFLLGLPSKFFDHARSGKNQYTVLRVESRSERLSEYERLVFEGINKLGIPVQVREHFSLPPGDRESEGFFMDVEW